MSIIAVSLWNTPALLSTEYINISANLWDTSAMFLQGIFSWRGYPWHGASCSKAQEAPLQESHWAWNGYGRAGACATAQDVCTYARYQRRRRVAHVGTWRGGVGGGRGWRRRRGRVRGSLVIINYKFHTYYHHRFCICIIYSVYVLSFTRGKCDQLPHILLGSGVQ